MDDAAHRVDEGRGRGRQLRVEISMRNTIRPRKRHGFKTLEAILYGKLLFLLRFELDARRLARWFPSLCRPFIELRKIIGYFMPLSFGAYENM
jgi:hypothetical protein